MTARPLLLASSLALCLVVGAWLALGRNPPRSPSPHGSAAVSTAIPRPPSNLPPAAQHVAPAVGFEITLDGQVFSDPRAALRFAEHGPEDRRLARYLRIVELWGPEDLVAATTWARSLPDASERSDVFARLGQIIRPVSPELAFDLADQLPEGPPRTRFLRELVHHWASENPAAAAEGLPRLAHTSPSETHAELASAIAMEWAQTDPRAAAAYVATRMAEGRARSDAARTVALRWAFLDPEAARGWIETFPDPRMRDELLALAALRAAPGKTR